MMSFFEYSSDYVPPMPVCQIFLGQSGKEPTEGPFEALIDTGADLTVIPLEDYPGWAGSDARDSWNV
jgi:hypothetical protein